MALWKHQIEAIQRAEGRDCFALLFDVGAGKTRCTIEILRDRYKTEGRLLRTLIICPLIVTRNWLAEFQKFSKIPKERIVILEGTEKKRCERLVLDVFPDPDKIVIINYDALAVMKKLMSLIHTWKPEVVVADEMHLLKNPKAERTKEAWKISKVARFRYGLTGTPILNNPMDIFSQWYFLDHGKTFGDNFFAFRGKYFVDKNSNMPKHMYFPKWDIRKGAVDDIKQKLQETSMAVKKEDALDLPPLIKQMVYVEMSPKQKKHYLEMKDDLITFFKSADKPSVALNSLTKSLRLMQICSGFLKLENGDVVDFSENPKAHALEELLESILPNKVIVWCVFKKDYEAVRKVCAKLDVFYVECHGDTSNADKFRNVERFNSDDNVKVFIGHPQSLGIGINLVAAKYMVYYSRSFSLGDDVQSEARNYRAGSEVHEKVTRYDIVIRGTIDEKCVDALHNKKQISDSVIKSWVFEEDS